MKTVIRPYTNADFNEICSWWEGHHETPPIYGMMVEDGTFVVEYQGERVMTVTALKTQSQEVAYLEGFCVKPQTDKKLSHEFSNILFDHACRYLKKAGYKRALIMTNKHRIMDRYIDLGMRRTLSGVFTLVREL